jgi:hypothetical protein
LILSFVICIYGWKSIEQLHQEELQITGS